MLQDAHIHIQDAGSEADVIASSAGGYGVGRFFCNASLPSGWAPVRSLADSFDNVIPFFGVHPWYADQVTEEWDVELKNYLQSPDARMGEIGLDASKKTVDFDQQRKIFTRQLDIAVEMKKPFVIHCVMAWDVLFEELEARKDNDLSFMLHWFSGSPEVAARLVAKGAYISFSPRLLYERAKKHRACLDVTPVDRILLETDYPYLLEIKEGEIFPPSKYFELLHALYAQAAYLKKMDEKKFIDRVWDNGTIFLH